MKILAVYSIKGGVGKTSAAVNLAYLAAADGKRTLVWDLDPQGASSYYFRIQPKIKGGGRALLRGKQALDGVIKGTDFERLDLVPADLSYRQMDILLDRAEKRPAVQLRQLLRTVRLEYDLAILDCPPSLSMMAKNVFRAADAVLVPVVPSNLSARTLPQLRDFLAAHGAFDKIDLLPFFSMVDTNCQWHGDIMQRLASEYPSMLRSGIPRTPEVERMGLHRMPLPAYAPDDAATRAYRSLWAELADVIRAGSRPRRS